MIRNNISTVVVWTFVQVLFAMLVILGWTIVNVIWIPQFAWTFLATNGRPTRVAVFSLH